MRFGQCQRAGLVRTIGARLPVRGAVRLATRAVLQSAEVSADGEGVVCALTWIGLFVAMETCAVLGAGGGIGNAVVWELAGPGLRVRAKTRDGRARVPDGVEAFAADLTRPEGAACACADAAVVYHCAQPRYTRWAEEFPALNASIVAAVTEAGAKLGICATFADVP